MGGKNHLRRSLMFLILTFSAVVCVVPFRKADDPERLFGSVASRPSRGQERKSVRWSITDVILDLDSHPSLISIHHRNFPRGGSWNLKVSCVQRLLRSVFAFFRDRGQEHKRMWWAESFTDVQDLNSHLNLWHPCAVLRLFVPRGASEASLFSSRIVAWSSWNVNEIERNLYGGTHWPHYMADRTWPNVCGHWAPLIMHN